MSGGSCGANGGPSEPSRDINAGQESEREVMSPTAIFTVEDQFMRELEAQQSSTVQNSGGRCRQGQGSGEGRVEISAVQVLYGLSLLVHMVQSIGIVCWLFVTGSMLYCNDDLSASAFAVFFTFAWITFETFFIKAALVADYMSDVSKFNYWIKYLEVLNCLIIIVVITLFFRDAEKLSSGNCLFLGGHFLLYGISYMIADLRLQEVKSESGEIDV